MTNWGYGKCCVSDTWSKNFPAAGGVHQSPINIVLKEVEYDENLEADKLKIKVINDITKEQVLIFSIHNFKVEADAESMSISGGPLSHLGKFQFTQLHFHWGKTEFENGSEHQFDGQRFASELHMVHFNGTKYKSFEEAVTEPDGILVLGILIQIGEKNDELDKLMGPLEKIRTLHKIKLRDEDGHLDLQSLLPKNTERYYSYSGSLTTPPCYESVTWIIFEKPITMTADQLSQLHWVHSDDKCGTGENFRPVCPINDRVVRKSFK